MNIEKMREEFDLWFIANAPQCAALALSGDKLRIAMREMAWFSWQASRAAIEVELPDYTSHRYGGDNFDECQFAADCELAVIATGLKVKT